MAHENESGRGGGQVAVVRLQEESLGDAVAIFCAAFRDYPVMRFILGDAGGGYDEGLKELVTYFTSIRFARGYPVLGVVDDGKLVGAANVNPPRPVAAPDRMAELARRLRDAIGPAAMERFDAFVAACEPLEPREPHYYLGMIGVPPQHQGRGHARRLLDHLHSLSAADPESTGVVLTTETRENLPLYEHFGYRILGEGRADELVTWVLFRPDRG